MSHQDLLCKSPSEEFASRTMSTCAYSTHPGLPRWQCLQCIKHGLSGPMGSYPALGSYQPRFVSVPKGLP